MASKHFWRFFELFFRRFGVLRFGVLLLVLFSLVGFALLLMNKDKVATQQLETLPWQVTQHADGSTEVFGIHLGNTSLRQSTGVLGLPEGIALFIDSAGKSTVEVYYGTVRFGPLSAKVIAQLAASDSEMEAMRQAATDKQGTAVGSFRYTLALSDQGAAIARTIQALTYIPTYADLDAEFLLRRFGAPAFVTVIDAEQQLWLYPKTGLTLVYDTAGKEIFHYVVPSALEIPTTALPWDPRLLP